MSDDLPPRIGRVGKRLVILPGEDNSGPVRRFLRRLTPSDWIKIVGYLLAAATAIALAVIAHLFGNAR